MPDIGVPPITPRFACLGLCPRHVRRCRSAAVVTYLLYLPFCRCWRPPPGDAAPATGGARGGGAGGHDARSGRRSRTGQGTAAGRAADPGISFGITVG